MVTGREPTEELVEPLSWTIWNGIRERSALDYLLARTQLGGSRAGSSRSGRATTWSSRPPWPSARCGSARSTPAATTRGTTSAARASFTPYTAIFNVTGQPAISLPLFHGDDGLPPAVQLAGRPAGEATLLGARRAARGRAPVGRPPARARNRLVNRRTAPPGMGPCGPCVGYSRPSRSQRRWRSPLACPTRTRSGHTSEEQTLGSGAPIFPGSSFETVAEGPGQPRVVRTLPGVVGARRARPAPPLARLLRPADRLPARRRGVARARRVRRLAAPIGRVAPAGGAPPVVDRLGASARSTASRRASPVAQARRRARAHGPRALDRRPRRQPAAATRPLGRGSCSRAARSTPTAASSRATRSAARTERPRSRRARPPADADEPTYTGVQDYDDHRRPAPRLLRPDEPAAASSATWPRYPGLMDRAQQPFTPVGLRRGATPVPTYVANGNHDGLVQGNAGRQSAPSRTSRPAASRSRRSPPALPIGDATRPEPAVRRPASASPCGPTRGGSSSTSAQLKARLRGQRRPGRRARLRVRRPAQSTRLERRRRLLRVDPKPGIRFIALDTVVRGRRRRSSPPTATSTTRSSSGSRASSTRAKRPDKLVVVFGHHPIRSLTTERAGRGVGAGPAPSGNDDEPRARPEPGLRPRPAQLDRRSISATETLARALFELRTRT